MSELLTRSGAIALSPAGDVPLLLSLNKGRLLHWDLQVIPFIEAFLYL